MSMLLHIDPVVPPSHPTTCRPLQPSHAKTTSTQPCQLDQCYAADSPNTATEALRAEETTYGCKRTCLNISSPCLLSIAALLRGVHVPRPFSFRCDGMLGPS
jgi:hypothetical protein